MPPKGKYTDPDLREQVKEEVKESDKGGAPGQWSARKAQFMASEYKKRGGGYTTDKESGQDDSQKHLDDWGKEDWQTKEGSGEAKQEDGSRKRYLPKKAWEEMSEGEKEATDEKKQAASKKGQQFVGNTDKAKKAGKNARESGGKEQSNGKDSKAASKQERQDDVEDDNDEDEDDEEYQEDEEDDGNEGEDAEEGEGNNDADDKENDEKAGHKRTRNASKKDDTPIKKQKGNSGDNKQANGKSKRKTMGSKHDSAEPPAPQGSNDRLPKKGQKVTWKAMPGWVHGEVVEVVTANKKMEGKDIKASKSEPRIALKAESGKFCVHKPDACYFEDE